MGAAMTTALAEACSDLEQWLPRAAALIAVPDTMAGAGTRTAPGSRPPWNADAADLVMEITAGLADAEQELRQAVTGTVRTRLPYRSTGRAMAAIVSLSEAAPDDTIAARISSWVNRIMTMPAIDAIDREKPVKVRQACPFCKLGDLRMQRQPAGTYRVCCLRLNQCQDRNGEHPRGVYDQSQLDGQWRIYWKDGTIT